MACKPTPFAYQAFQAFIGLQSTGLLMLCISCVSRQRRAMLAKNRLKNHLLVDKFILSSLQPGSVSIPEQRCILLLLQSLRQPHYDWMKGLLLGGAPCACADHPGQPAKKPLIRGGRPDPVADHCVVGSPCQDRLHTQQICCQAREEGTQEVFRFGLVSYGLASFGMVGFR